MKRRVYRRRGAERERGRGEGRQAETEGALYAPVQPSLSIVLCLSAMRKGSKLSLRKQAAAAAANTLPLRSPLNPVNSAATAPVKPVEKETVRQRETLADDAPAEEPIAPARTDVGQSETLPLARSVETPDTEETGTDAEGDDDHDKDDEEEKEEGDDDDDDDDEAAEAAEDVSQV